MAAQRGHTSICEILTKHNAHVNAVDQVRTIYIYITLLCNDMNDLGYEWCMISKSQHGLAIISIIFTWFVGYYITSKYILKYILWRL